MRGIASKLQMQLLTISGNVNWHSSAGWRMSSDSDSGNGWTSFTCTYPSRWSTTSNKVSLLGNETTLTEGWHSATPSLHTELCVALSQYKLCWMQTCVIDLKHWLKLKTYLSCTVLVFNFMQISANDNVLQCCDVVTLQTETFHVERFQWPFELHQACCNML